MAGLVVLVGVAVVVRWTVHAAHSVLPVAAATPHAVLYRNPSLGIAFQHPDSWRSADTADGVTFTAGGQDAMLVTKTMIAHPVQRAQLGDVKVMTDALLNAPEAHLTMVAATPVTVAGHPALYYLYYFDNHGVQGVHAHYFVFDRTAMYTIVFQALPSADFQRLSSSFDAVIATLSIMPRDG